MKRFFPIIGLVTLTITLFSFSCTNPVKKVEEPVKIENTLQSVSYFKDTLSSNPDELLKGIISFNEAIDKIGYPDAGYEIWIIKEDESGIRFMVQGNWPNEEVYEEIHEHELFKEASKTISEIFTGLVSVEYHQFKKLK